MTTEDRDACPAWCYPCDRGGPREQIGRPCPQCGARCGVSEAEWQRLAAESARRIAQFRRVRAIQYPGPRSRFVLLKRPEP